MKAFTLVELMVVITIIGILSVGAYVPYDYYGRLSQVRVSTERIQQTLEHAKILSQNGQLFPGSTHNANIGLLFSTGSHAISMFAFSGNTHTFTEDENAKIIKTIQLEDNVNINSLPYNQVLVEYRAPNGTMEIYKNETETGANFIVGIGFKTATSGALYKEVKIEK